MRVHGLLLPIDPARPEPIYRQLAGAVVQAIRDGRLRPGATLPGTRELAEQLGIHRNTVLQAMRELQAEGWVVMRERAGVFVADPLPVLTPRAAPATPEPPPAPAFELPDRLDPLSTASTVKLDWSDGLADVRLAPTEAMARAYQRALRLKGPELLSSGEFQGQRRLREALAAHLGQQRALAAGPEQLLITRGTPMSLSLVAQALLGSEGGDVAVEDPGLPLVLDTLRQASGASLHPVPVDGEGLDTDALARLAGAVPLRLVVVSPQAQAPTGVPLAPSRRWRLLDLARAHRFAILELDAEYDHLPGPAMPPRPLAAEDREGLVIYVGSLSRLLAPGLRLGFLAAPGALASRLAKARQRMDWQGDRVLEWALSELFLDGEVGRHLRKVRKATRERREALTAGLAARFQGKLAWREDAGAMGLWVEGRGPLEDPLRMAAWIQAAGMLGIKLLPGRSFTFDGRALAATRIGFTASEPEEIALGLDLLAKALGA
ncbi:MAG TPA: PLP-dependent aminotransferase family protein [Holophagaceae bacterium]|nr:PLP-dependent aminotransferase family protein [Holophagaceae bacterium]